MPVGTCGDIIEVPIDIITTAASCDLAARERTAVQSSGKKWAAKLLYCLSTKPGDTWLFHTDMNMDKAAAIHFLVGVLTSVYCA
jgi:hypothetical protein